ncbi:MAG TPA: hypothetical protein VFM35_05625 [Candidatus Binatia bacterium]|nr:hypothetical protein [Candidatus Binatia bacterium]
MKALADRESPAFSPDDHQGRLMVILDEPASECPMGAARILANV